MSEPAAERDLPPDEEAAGETVAAVEGVACSFGAVTVLEDVSFDLEAGTVTAVVGPNGSGKTTLLRIVAGLLAADDGTVSVEHAGGRRAGYLPQSPAFRPTFTVAETLSFYDALLGPVTQIEEPLERVGLTAVRDRRVDALSGGMRRLLGLAVATLGDPSLVVLDEPTGDLDPRMTDRIFELVADLADGGAAVLLATHNLTGAGGADRVLVLDEGGLVGQGPPAELLERASADSLQEAFRTLVREDVGPRSGVSE